MSLCSRMSKLNNRLVAVSDSPSRILNQSVYSLLVSPRDLVRLPDLPQGKASWPELLHPCFAGPPLPCLPAKTFPLVQLTGAILVAGWEAAGFGKESQRDLRRRPSGGLCSVARPRRDSLRRSLKLSKLGPAGANRGSQCFRNMCKIRNTKGFGEFWGV